MRPLAAQQVLVVLQVGVAYPEVHIQTEAFREVELVAERHAGRHAPALAAVALLVLALVQADVEVAVHGVGAYVETVEGVVRIVVFRFDVVAQVDASDKRAEHLFVFLEHVRHPQHVAVHGELPAYVPFDAHVGAPRQDQRDIRFDGLRPGMAGGQKRQQPDDAGNADDRLFHCNRYFYFHICHAVYIGVTSPCSMSPQPTSSMPKTKKPLNTNFTWCLGSRWKFHAAALPFGSVTVGGVS